MNNLFKSIVLILLLTLVACSDDKEVSEADGDTSVSARSSPMTLFQFYRLKVSLTHKPDSKPVDINLVFGCGSKTRQALGEGATSIGIRVPNIYGIKLESGEGVLVQTPDVCGKDPKEIIPDDFMPLVFYAPDADDLEFMIAHVSTISYDQEFSKLLFHNSTVEKVSEDDFKKWQKEGMPNIIETRLTVNGFYEGIFSLYYPPENDIRFDTNPISCYSMIRVPIPDGMKPQIREWWPQDKPHFWVPTIADRNFNLYWDMMKKATKEVTLSQTGRDIWGRDNNNLFDGEAGSSGIYNRRGQGGINISEYGGPNATNEMPLVC